jgi:hypothetical protein
MVVIAILSMFLLRIGHATAQFDNGEHYVTINGVRHWYRIAVIPRGVGLWPPLCGPWAMPGGYRLPNGNRFDPFISGGQRPGREFDGLTY